MFPEEATRDPAKNTALRAFLLSVGLVHHLDGLTAAGFTDPHSLKGLRDLIDLSKDMCRLLPGEAQTIVNARKEEERTPAPHEAGGQQCCLEWIDTESKK